MKAPSVMWQCEIEANGLVWSKFRRAFVPAAGQRLKPVEDLAKEFWFFTEKDCDEVCRSLATLGVTSQSVKYLQVFQRHGTPLSEQGALNDEPQQESGQGDEHDITDGAAGAAGQAGD